MSAANEKLIIGKVSGAYGVKGWVKVFSETDPREGITTYNPWYVRKDGQGEWREVQVEHSKRQAKTIVAKLAGIDDRDAALCLTGAAIAIRPDQLQALDEDEYYWRDLIGLRVVNREGIELGAVLRLIETGANDVLVVGTGGRGGKEHLVPWTPGEAIVDVDLERGSIRVDWDADF